MRFLGGSLESRKEKSPNIMLAYKNRTPGMILASDISKSWVSKIKESTVHFIVQVS